MNEIYQWFLDNYTWLFSGIGGAALLFFIKFLFSKRKQSLAHYNSIESGENCTNIITDGDVNVAEINNKITKKL